MSGVQLKSQNLLSRTLKKIKKSYIDQFFFFINDVVDAGQFMAHLQHDVQPIEQGLIRIIHLNSLQGEPLNKAT